MRALKKEGSSVGSCSPMPDNLLKWKGCIFGPTDSPFEDGSFFIKLLFSEEYPFDPPQVWPLSVSPWISFASCIYPSCPHPLNPLPHASPLGPPFPSPCFSPPTHAHGAPMLFSHWLFRGLWCGFSGSPVGMMALIVAAGL